MYSQVVGFTSEDVAAAWARCGWTLLIGVVMIMMMSMIMMLMQALLIVIFIVMMMMMMQAKMSLQSGQAEAGPS